MLPMVSVIMPAYNAEKTIFTAVQSVLNQTYRNFELIVVDDLSSDNTEQIIRQFDDSRIVYIKNNENKGASFSRNRGVSLATGKWIAFLDSDDYWRSDKLKKQMDFHKKNKEAILSYTASAFMNEEGQAYKYIMGVEKKIDYKYLLNHNVISCSSVIIKADIMKSIEMPGDYMSEDYYIWLMVLKKYQFAYGINEPLLTYRISHKSKSSNRLKAALMTYETYKSVGYSVLISGLLTMRYAVYSIQKRYKIKKLDNLKREIK